MAATRTRTRTTVALAGLTAAATYGLTRVFASGPWLVALLAAGAGVHALLAWASRRRWGLLSEIAVVLVSGTYGAMLLVESYTLAGWVPSMATLRAFGRDLGHVGSVLRTAVVPVDPGGAALLLAFVAVVVCAALSHWIAFRLDAPLGGITPSLVLFISIAALGKGPQSRTVAIYAIAGLVYLVFQNDEEVSERRSWFHAADVRRSRVLVGGAAVAVVIVAAALVIGPALPGATSDPWLDVRKLGKGQGDGTIELDSPVLEIQKRLNDLPNVEVLTVGAAQQANWRLTAYDTYENNGWYISDERGSSSDLNSSTSPPRFRQLEQHIRLLNVDSDWVPAAYKAKGVSLPNAQWSIENEAMFNRPSLPAGTEYTVVSELPDPTPEDLRNVRPLDGGSYGNYLELPDNFSDRMGQLAVDVTQGTTTQYDQALALQNYLRTSLKYDRTVETETIDAFLFENKAGYCVHFATAMTLMARSLGIPARMAVGFTPGEYDSANQEFHVFGKHAHAWPELLFPGWGWIAFEPTPGRGDPSPSNHTGVRPLPLETPNGPSTSSATTSTTNATGSSSTLSPPTSGGSVEVQPHAQAASGPSAAQRALMIVGGMIGAAALAVAGFVGAVLFVRRRRMRTRRYARDPRDRVIGAWSETLDRLSEAGIQPRPSATPMEFALRHAPARGAGAAGPPLIDLAHLQTAALFARGAPSEADATAAWARADEVQRVLRAQVQATARWKRRLDPRTLRAPSPN